MLLPGPRVFRSRWWALAWAVGVVWFAWDVAGSSPAQRTDNTVAQVDAAGDSYDADDVAAMRELARDPKAHFTWMKRV